MHSGDACKPPSYEEATLQDLPGLKEILPRGEFVVYTRNINDKHEIKSADKTLLYKAKWKAVDSSNHKLIVETADKKEVLNMTRKLEGAGTLGLWSKKEMVMTAVPDIPIGRITKSEKRKYEVIDQTGHVVFYVETVVNSFNIDKYFKIVTLDGKEIGKIDFGEGKHKLQVPSHLSLSHKVLLLGLTLSKQNIADDAQGGVC